MSVDRRPRGGLDLAVMMLLELMAENKRLQVIVDSSGRNAVSWLAAVAKGDVENQRLQARMEEFEKQRTDYHHIVSELARCERDHDALLHENDILRSRVAGADQRAARYSEELTLAVSASKQIAKERDNLVAENAALLEIVREVAGMRVETEIFDQPLYALMHDDHETNGAWHLELVAKARARLEERERPNEH